MRHTLKKTTAGTAVTTAVLLAVTAGTAHASMVGQSGYSTFRDGCPVGYCGAAWPIPATQTLNTCYSVPTGANDRWTAFSNNTNRNVEVHTGGSCSGYVATLYAYTQTGQMGKPFNDSISSYVWRK